MINALYDIGKLVIEEEYDGKSLDELSFNDKLSIYLDNDQISNSTNIIYVDFQKQDNNIEFIGTTFTEFDPYESNKLLYKKGSSRGTNLSPTTIITELNKSYKNKFVKWFSNNKKDEFISLIYDEIDNHVDDIKDSILSTLVNNELSNDKGKIKGNNKVLLSIRIKEDDKFNYLSDYPIFGNIVIDQVNEKYYRSGSKKIKGNGICYLCDNEKELYGLVPSSIGLTFATADKAGSIPGLNIKNQWKQAGICQDCALYLTVGKNFIEENMNFSEFDLHYYAIPKFLVNPSENFDEIYDFIEDNKNKKYEDELVSEEDEIKEIVDKMGDVLEFKYLYYEASNNSFKILGYVESLLPSWLGKIYQKQLNIENEEKYPMFSEDNMKKILGPKVEGNLITILRNMDKYDRLSSSNWYAGILRSFMPYKTKNKYYLDIITSILSRRKLDFNFLLSIFMDTIRSSWKDNHNEYILKLNILRSLVLIVFLDDLDLFKGGRIMNNETEDILKKLNSDSKKASFLLGVLTKKLTNIQYSRINATPFINKLNGFSLNHKDIQKLYPKIINKLREYEVAYIDLENRISELLLSSEDNWNLTRDETSYYFTLGYTMNNKYDKKQEGVDINE
ncbi:TIGR02556 family CRISPR-associated protein [uncultured Methanosphaera sp.]|uniref:TIGR02556 family CRISPR-associated protein n=1 Tax=uncultured Methanosphaera sp. TaxID=262501 RepID=UPI0025F11C8C|nr:TIGR02556 family CRISPR-associated protein [uncultured Methanosphaera sp.]